MGDKFQMDVESNKDSLFEVVSKMPGTGAVTPKKEEVYLDVTSDSPITNESPLGKRGWLDCTEAEKAEYIDRQKKGLPITPVDKSPGGTEYIRMRMKQSVKNKNIALSAKKREINRARKTRHETWLKHKAQEKWRCARFGVQFEDTPEKVESAGVVSPSTSDKKKWDKNTPVNMVPTPTVVPVKVERKAALKKKKKLNL